eukprot:g5489.t1
MNLMLTGMPAVGKTTLVQRVIERLANKIDLTRHGKGFYTEEVLGPTGRIGFDVVALSGRRGILSRKGNPPFLTTTPRIGSYLVNVTSFESVAIPEIRQNLSTRLIVIDEIGKMEFYSESFQEAVKEAMDSNCVVFGVVPKIRQIQTYSGVSLGIC